jgi:hypothetical protein
MTDPPDLATTVGASAVQGGLRLRSDIHAEGWTFWELRNLNMHRVVGLLRAQRAFADVPDLEGEIRTAISRDFKRAWWRGLAYGVVAEVEQATWTPGDLEAMVDIRENRKGVLQWVVLASPVGRRAVGVHTWEQVFLSPVYREVVAALSGGGYQVATAAKGKDGLMRVLTDVSALEGAPFPEFRDHP